MRRFPLLVALALSLLVAACAAPAPKPDRLTLEPASFAELDGWQDDRQDEALAAFRRSCAALEKRPADAAVSPERIGGTVGDWLPACRAALALSEGADAATARAFFERWFTPFAAANNGERSGLFTGYYEPEVRGSAMPSARYRVPLYARPSDLVTVDLGQFRDDLAGIRVAGRVADGALVPYEDRAAIERGALEGRAEPLVWLDDPVDAFFLEIQGSGRVRFEDGSLRRIGYAAGNGHVYFAVGRELVRRGELAQESVSLQAIRAWLRAHASEATALLDLNPAYVFFRWLPGEGSEPGPEGAAGVALTPGRSLAVDRRFLPLGAPLWLETTRPGFPPGESERPLDRLVIAQDTGGAIAGPVRGDLFWGAGEEAEWAAGQMRSEGRYYLLLPRALGERVLAGLREGAP